MISIASSTSILQDASVDLIATDIPFNTGKTQKMRGRSYSDSYSDFSSFIKPHLADYHRVLAANGTLALHADYREIHYLKVWLDEIFGRASFLNEIIWAYDYGGRSKKKWAAKHDTILIYVKDPQSYYFDYDAMDRIPYMAPGLVGPEKAARGKTPTDVWWHTIVPTNGKERLGYPTQKPLGIYERIIKVHCPKNGLVVDPFAGSGTTGAAAKKHGRRYIMIDNNPEAISIMKKRLS